jgi:hypothetical protein
VAITVVTGNFGTTRRVAAPSAADHPLGGA